MSDVDAELGDVLLPVTLVDALAKIRELRASHAADERAWEAEKDALTDRMNAMQDEHIREQKRLRTAAKEREAVLLANIKALEQIASEAGRRWGAMSDSEKQPFTEQADEAMEVREPTPVRKPNRPLSDFFLYMNDARATIKAENPDMSVMEITFEAGRRWKTMSDSEKQPFTDQAEEAKEEYIKAMEEHGRADKATQECTKAIKEAERRKCAVSDEHIREPTPMRKPNRPLRPLSGFFLYMNDARATIKAENPDMAVKEIASEAGRRWGAMSDSEKQPFREQAEEAKEEYVKAMEEFEANKGSDYESDEKPAKRKRGKKKERDENMPKRPMSGFFLYMNDARATIKAENPDMSVKEIASEAGRRWKTMSDSEKQPFVEQAEEAKEEYIKAMEEFVAQ